MTGPRSPIFGEKMPSERATTVLQQLTAYLHMLHAAWMSKLCSSRIKLRVLPWMWSARNVVSLRL